MASLILPPSPAAFRAVRIGIARDARDLLLRDDAEIDKKGHNSAARRAQAVDGVAHEARRIERTDAFGDHPAEFDALGLDDLGDLVADAV